MIDRQIDQSTQEAGLGLAAFLIVSTLLEALAQRDVLSRDELDRILKHALSNAKQNQPDSLLVGANAAAAKAIGALLSASEQRVGKKQTPQ